MANTSIADLAALAHDFDSPDWNSAKALRVLHTHRANRSAVPAICHAMKKLPDADLMHTLMQMVHFIVVFDMPELEELLMERCHHSMNFALRMFFLLQAAMEDEVPELAYKTNRLWKQCELAAINAENTCPPRNRVCVENGSFRRKSQKGLLGDLPSPKLARSSSLTDLVGSVPYQGSSESLYSSTSILPCSPMKSATSESLYASTSILPRGPIVTSPVASPPKPISQSQPGLGLKQNYAEHSTVADLMEAANVNPELQSPELSRCDRPLSPSLPSPAIPTTIPFAAPSSSSTTTTTTTQTSSLDQILAQTSISDPPPSASLSSSSSSLSPPPASLSSSSSITSSIIQPSYASAVPSIDSIKRPPPMRERAYSLPHVPSSSSSSRHHPPGLPPSADHLGASFFFKLRQLSGEGQAENQRVYEYFYTELHMINSLFNISTALMSISLDGAHKLKEVRGRALQLLLAQINTQLIQSETPPPSAPSSSDISAFSPRSRSLFLNESLTYGVEIPVVPGWVIIKIHPEDSFCLSSRNRVPYMMLIEVLAFDPESDTTTLIANQPQHQTRAHAGQAGDPDTDSEEEWVLLSDEAPRESTLKKGFIELWSEKEKRIRETSPFSQLPGWKLAGVIVKSGDDLRQEQLASQLISKIHNWFQDEKLPLFLRPYVVLATSSTTGLIECIPDTCSIDSLKKRIPNFGSLTNYFICSYGHKTSNRFIVAQTNFIESLAAYSLVCYLLQIKDRHNGNILLDIEGHMIHIDFGFMLSISPGNLGFELAPFKLNQEMIDLMGGVQSDMFKYFKTLLLSGLLEVRRHADELLLLVEVMTTHSRMACFSRGGAQVLAGLRDRLALDKTEEQCLLLVDTLVYNAMRSWTTQSYDSYQYYTNGIL